MTKMTDHTALFVKRQRRPSTMPAKFRLDPQRGLARLDLNDHVRFFGVEVTVERHECGSSGLPKDKMMSKAFFAPSDALEYSDAGFQPSPSHTAAKREREPRASL